jgi:hypothetical protein
LGNNVYFIKIVEAELGNQYFYFPIINYVDLTIRQKAKNMNLIAIHLLVYLLGDSNILPI